MVYPTRAEGQRLRRQRRPVQAKVQLLDLASGKDVTMENVRRFAFAGERGGWIAFQKAPATSGGAGGGSAPPAGPGGASGSGAAAATDRPKGADLILRDLATGRDLNIGNVAEFAFDKSGRYLALVIDAPDKAGNGVQLRNMESGVVSVLDSDKASYERLAWTEKGDGLAVVKGTEDKRYTDKVYAAIGFWDLGAAGGPQRAVYDPAADKTFPEGMSIAPSRGATWTEDLTALVFGIRTLKKSDAKPEAPSRARPARTRRRNLTRPRLQPPRRRPTKTRSISSCGTTRTRACSRSSRCRRRWTRTSATCPSTASRRTGSSASPTNRCAA